MGAAKKDKAELIGLIEIFTSFPLMKGFPHELMNSLAEAAEVISVPPGVEVLKQGQLNNHLYFLLEGQIGVYVDGGRVSKMQQKGDLLGEMSVINGRAVGATLLTESKVTLIRVDSKVFLDMRGPQRDFYLSVIYRIYATVLVDKLRLTNEKAKHFEAVSVQLKAAQFDLEDANRNLEKKVEERTQKLETQNAALMVGNRKMEELLNTQRVLFQRLSEFYEKHLSPLMGHLQDIQKKHPTEQGISDAEQVVANVQLLLGPLTEHYSSQQAMNSKRVLLADSNKKQQVTAKMALGGTGVELEIVSNVDEGKEKIQSSSYDLLFVDAACLELCKEIQLKNPAAGVVLMTSEPVPSYLPKLKSLSAIPHIVSRDESDRTFSVKNIVTTVSKLLSRDFFGLEKYLSWGIDIQSLPVTSSRSRPEIIAKVESYFEKLGVRRANRERIRIVLEEMLMNAIYDAPVDADGKSIYNHLPRTVDLNLKATEQSVVRFATDGMLIAVSVQDPFGSLKGSTILRYLEHNYAGSAANINERENKGGAGRGLHQIVENSDLVVFNIQPGKRTEAIAFFNVEVKEAVNQTPSFHLFFKS